MRSRWTRTDDGNVAAPPKSASPEPVPLPKGTRNRSCAATPMARVQRNGRHQVIFFMDTEPYMRMRAMLEREDVGQAAYLRMLIQADLDARGEPPWPTEPDPATR